jgi:hypothetical protein
MLGHTFVHRSDPSYLQRDASQIHSDLMQRIKECSF